MICVECEINTDLGLFDLETNGKQEVNDLCNYHDEIFEVEE